MEIEYFSSTNSYEQQQQNQIKSYNYDYNYKLEQPSYLIKITDFNKCENEDENLSNDEKKEYYELKPAEAPHVRRIGCYYDDFCIEDIISEKTILDYDHEIETSSHEYYSYDENSLDDDYWDYFEISSKRSQESYHGNGVVGRYTNASDDDDIIILSPYQCSKCDETFHMSQNLFDHLQEFHQTEINYKCYLCNEFFENANSLTLHMVIHKDVKRPFVCIDCDKKFKTFDYLENHRSNKMCNTNQNICAVCGKEFKNQFNLVRHRSVHTNERPFKCSMCGKQFKQQDNLNVHIRCHKIERPFKCEKCPKTFKDENYLMRHKKLHLQTSDNDGITCSICHKPFKLFIYLEKHMRVHRESGKFHECSQCCKPYRNVRKLNRHLEGHFVEGEIIKCGICSEEFENVSLLIQHIVIHSDDYNENDENDTSKITNSSQEVMVTPNKIKKVYVKKIKTPKLNKEDPTGPEKDMVCTAGSIRRRGLKRVYRKCGICKIKFKTVEEYLEHNEQHKDKRPFKCDVCKKRFKTPGYLVKHTRNFHSDEVANSQSAIKLNTSSSSYSNNEDTIDNDTNCGDDSSSLMTNGG